MTRRIKRSKDYQLTLEVKNEQFIRPPREAQRNWLINRTLKEFGEDLGALSDLASRFAPGKAPVDPGDRTQANLRDDEIMEDWQIPIMEAMAELVARGNGDVLEIGFGRGVASTFLQELGLRSHTIVECNDHVVERYRTWAASYPGREFHLIHGRWQDKVEDFGTYDGVFFHTYPLNEDEYMSLALRSITFAEHFFSTAAGCLRSGGVFTYLSNEMDSLSRSHQRLLLSHFRSFEVQKVSLELPPTVRDAWWADSMVVVGAVK